MSTNAIQSTLLHPPTQTDRQVTHTLKKSSVLCNDISVI